MKPVGPYTPIVQAGDLYFVSGQIGIEGDSGSLVDGIAAQTQQAMVNLSSLLNEAGLSMQNVVKVNLYLTDMDHYDQVNMIYEENFAGHKPARAAVGVASLPKGALIEIEAIAHR